jgi:hypothetical protein
VRKPVDRVSLTAGLVLIGAGGLLALDQTGTIELTLGLTGALISAVVGTILLITGLSDDGG